MKYAILAVCCLAVVAFAQGSFMRTYGGVMEDYGFSARQTPDGGYIMVGRTESHGAGGNDVWLVRTDETGDTLWTRAYGGSGYDVGRSVVESPDGGFIFTGYTSSFGAGGYDAWLVKTDESGDSVWTRTLGGVDNENGFSVLVAPDSGYVVAGYTNTYGAGDYDIWLVRTDGTGDTLWTRTYGGPGFDAGMSVRQTADGGYIIAGGTQSFGAGDYDVWLLRVDSMGDTAWTRAYGGPGGDYAYMALPTSDDGFVVVGFTASFGAGDDDIWLLKTDSMGDTAWTRTFGDSARDLGYSVDMTADSGYVIVGLTGSPFSDCRLIKTDGDGVLMWTRTFSFRDTDVGCSVEQTADGGYIIGGYTSYYVDWSDFWLIKTDSVGLVAIEEPEAPCSRRAAAATIVSRALRFQPTHGNSQQPADLLDIAGRRVMELRPGENDVRGVAPGVYFCRLTAGSASSALGSAARKVVIAR